jgi:hypothetical protein
MTSGTLIGVMFTCPNPECGMHYSAIREQHPDLHSGSFNCEDCSAEVYRWSGVYDFYDWKPITMMAPRSSVPPRTP